MLTVTLAHPGVLEALRRDPDLLPPGVRLVAWDPADALPDDVPAADVDVVVLARADRERLERLHALPALRVVQLPSAGYEHAVPHAPGSAALCNARGVHDAGTAELAVALLLASQRGIDDAVRDAQEGRWRPQERRSLADRRVMVLGHGSIGAAVARRLEPFEVDVVRVASRPRTEDGAPVHGVQELGGLLPTVDAVVAVLPLTEATRGLLGAEALAALPDGAVVVNVGRGAVVDTDALVAEVSTGRLRAALDVVDPEPLPADHPLWRAPGVVLTPHVGGHTDATIPRMADLVRRQVAALVAGAPPLNVVRAVQEAAP
ncbi:NAD(P)-dependent oxidoreductase [Actinotalea sp. Marseille-Q4924]|uniref:NAD(P)-dependent oxidoreductase n=1 Tax=Actinotalea sp. Marseille-Q4924 TaxID=2866571 RepID=UPI001CE42B2B|nr:NAD(P)-dependent oxidoreductase [Actinotalea sp. Marseille-Q4924]